MTNDEIHEYINIRNGYLGGDEIIRIVTTSDKPQIDHVIYKPNENKIHLWSRDGEHFEFTPIPYEDDIKNKVKKK